MCRCDLPLARVAAMGDELVSRTIELLVLRTSTRDQLVLSLSREQALLGMQQLLHSEMASTQPCGDRVMRIVRTILDTALAFVADELGESIPYKQPVGSQLSSMGYSLAAHGITLM